MLTETRDEQWQRAERDLDAARTELTRLRQQAETTPCRACRR